MKIGRIFAFCMAAAVCVSCSLEPFDENPLPVGPTDSKPTISEESTMFVKEEKSDVYVFQTNDRKYLGSRGYTLWGVKNINQSDRFEPLSVQITKQGGRAEAGFGMVFCEQEIENKSFLLTVLLNANGLYAIGKIVDGAFIHLNNGWVESEFINKGLGVSNDISVTYSEEKECFNLKINGQEITSFSVAEEISFKNSRSGYVVVIASDENFPSKPVKVIFRNN